MLPWLPDDAVSVCSDCFIDWEVESSPLIGSPTTDLALELRRPHKAEQDYNLFMILRHCPTDDMDGWRRLSVGSLGISTALSRGGAAYSER